MKRISIAVAAGAALLLGTALPAVAAHFGPGGRLEADLIAGQTIPAGLAAAYNTKSEFRVEIVTQDGWLIKEAQVYVGTGTIPVTKSGNAVPGKYPYRTAYKVPVASHLLVLDLEKQLGFSWGAAFESLRFQKLSIHAELVKLDSAGKVIAQEGAWAYNDLYASPFPGDQWDWWVQFELAHPMRGHFVDSPVAGLGFRTSTAIGKTDAAGGFDYFPGELVSFAAGRIPLGEALADHRVTPLDLFVSADSDHVGVINVARLLQTLDADRAPQNGIAITATAESCLNRAATSLCSARTSRRRRRWRPRSRSSSFMPVLVPATKANGDPIVSEFSDSGYGVDYYDEAGNYLYTREKVQPLVAVYADQIPENRHAGRLRRRVARRRRLLEADEPLPRRRPLSFTSRTASRTTATSRSRTCRSRATTPWPSGRASSAAAAVRATRATSTRVGSTTA
jgi:hypothetical protein